MKTKKAILLFAIIGKLLLSVLIIKHYWSTQQLSGIVNIPIDIIIYAVVYIGLQMLTRNLSIVQNWWDWVYYFGLVSMMIPTLFATIDNKQMFNIITDVGVLGLLLPTLVDALKFAKSEIKNKE